MGVASALCREKEGKKGAQEIIQRYFEGFYFTLGEKVNWSNTKLLKPNYNKTRAECKKCHAKTMIRNQACEAQFWHPSCAAQANDKNTFMMIYILLNTLSLRLVYCVTRG
jgi:hypothetical protein